MNSLSYIVVTYNSAGTIADCLTALRRDAGEIPRPEIIVVDNASADETAGLVVSHYPDVTIRRLDRNTGFAAAANIGAEIASGDYLCFINPDAVVDPDFGDKLGSLLSSPRPVDLAGGVFRTPAGLATPSSWCLPRLGTIAIESFLPYEIASSLTAVDLPGISEVDMISGGCMIIRHTIFDLLGRFDERFFLYYEDADLCQRARSAGYTILRCPFLRAVHDGRKSFGDDLTLFFYRFYQSKLLYCAKHFSPSDSRLAIAMIMAGLSLRGTAYALTAGLTGKEQFSRLASQHREALKLLKGERLTV